MTYRVEHFAEGVTVYCGRCEEILPSLGTFDAVVTDPPYGLGDLWKGGKAKSKARWKLNDGGDACGWDATAPDVTGLLNVSRFAIIWGGHLLGLPTARGWLVWNKIIRNWSSGECELAWTNIEQPVRAFDYSHGQLATEGKFHPTQKPEPLMRWCLEQLPDSARSILDPYMGAGTTGVSSVRTGRSFTGIEQSEAYFDIACRRISDELSRPSLFSERPAPAVQGALL